MNDIPHFLDDLYSGLPESAALYANLPFEQKEKLNETVAKLDQLLLRTPYLKSIGINMGENRGVSPSNCGQYHVSLHKSERSIEVRLRSADLITGMLLTGANQASEQAEACFEGSCNLKFASIDAFTNIVDMLCPSPDKDPNRRINYSGASCYKS